MPEVASPQVDITRATGIIGWMSNIELVWLATQALTRKYIVEFGSFHGRSARVLADNMPEDGKLWCVDPWSNAYTREDGEILPFTTAVFPFFRQNLRDHIKSGRVIPIHGFSYDFSLPHKVDMVFIDGDHKYKTVMRDIMKAYELLDRGGLICGHDYNVGGWEGVKRAVDEIFGPTVEVVDTIWYRKY